MISISIALVVRVHDPYGTRYLKWGRLFFLYSCVMSVFVSVLCVFEEIVNFQLVDDEIYIVH